MKDLSQYKEYTFLKEYFEKYKPSNKIVIDVGAKGIQLSNSLNFILDDNWKGILIEPFRKGFLRLSKFLEFECSTFVINVAISDYSGKGKLYLHDIDGHNSLVNETEEYQKCNIYTLPYILDKFNIPKAFDLLTIDAEGMDKRILKYTFKNSQYRPRIIIHEKLKGKIFPILLGRYGYTLLHETRGNCIYRRIL